jgi:hypothetical protein
MALQHFLESKAQSRAREGAVTERKLRRPALTHIFACVAVAAFWVAPATARAAGNDRCLVCHVNYKAEQLAASHLKQDIDCAQCHGSSSAHCSDEDNLTPPEKMYPRSKIAALCAECHPKHNASVPAADMKAKVCTDCHGKHRLAVRTRVWDKETGKLVKEK